MARALLEENRENDWTELRASIVAIRVEKCAYFFILIASCDTHSFSPYCPYCIRKCHGNLCRFRQNICHIKLLKFRVKLWLCWLCGDDGVLSGYRHWIWSGYYWGSGQGPWVAQFCHVYIRSRSFLVGWSQAVINVFLSEDMFHMPWKSGDPFPSQEVSIGSGSIGQLSIQSPIFPFSGEGRLERGRPRASKGSGESILSCPITVRFQAWI